MGLFSGLKKNKGDAGPSTSSVAARATTVSFACSTPALVPKDTRQLHQRDHVPKDVCWALGTVWHFCLATSSLAGTNHCLAAVGIPTVHAVLLYTSCPNHQLMHVLRFAFHHLSSCLVNLVQKEPMTQEEIEELCLELNKIGVSQQHQDVRVQPICNCRIRPATCQLTSGG
jgi:hypothetical protein